MVPQPARTPGSPIPSRSGIKGFELLMPFRIREVLLVSSLYDAFIMEEEGQILEPLLADYSNLNLRYAPRVRRASSSLEAMDMLSSQERFDLVILTPQLADVDPVEFAREIKEEHAPLPVVLIGYDTTAIRSLVGRGRQSPFDAVLLWTGDSRVLVAAIKLIEDRINFLHDSSRVGVQAVLLVEDSLTFLSLYLPLLYTEILLQSQRVIAESPNLSHKLLRLRARPKVLLAQDVETAWETFAEHGQNILGIICDAGLPPRRGEDPDPEAGFALVRRIHEADPLVPVLIQSADPGNEEQALYLGAAFLDKNTPRLQQGIRQFMLENCGFGPFVFRSPDGTIQGQAANIRELERLVRTVPDDSLIFHAIHNHFSTWLRARTEFSLADLLAPKGVTDFPSAAALRSYLVKTLHEARRENQRGVVADFNPGQFDSTISFSRIGHGSLGGKARGLAFINYLLRYYEMGESFPDVEITVPPVVVVSTEYFDRFMEENGLYTVASESLTQEQLRRRFLYSSLPRDLVEDLRAVLRSFEGPLAVRSSSLLEDSHLQPFAGIYETYMLANAAESEELRLRDLVQAIKLVYASTFSDRAKAFLRATPYLPEEEKMAVILQQVFGRWHGRRFYPTFAGIARSHNYYPHGPIRPDDGVALVALGLGRLVVEGLGGLRFCPRHPQHLPQFSDPKDILENAQRTFFAIDLEDQSSDPASQPRAFPIATADEDGVLSLLASTWCPEEEVIRDGTSRPGVRVVTFASILKHRSFPLPEVVDELLRFAAWGLGSPVEIEFAVDLETPPEERRRLALLQMRPMVVSQEGDGIDLASLRNEDLVVASDRALGNGRIEGLRDILLVDPADFDRARSAETVRVIRDLNAALQREGRPFLLIGPGRWGSRDPWLGIPVEWNDIAGARVVVETGFRKLYVEPSEGSHFFNNMTSFQVGYLTVNPQRGEGLLDLDWLRQQPVATRRPNGVLHLRLEQPLLVLLDGRTARGRVVKPGAVGGGV